MGALRKVNLVHVLSGMKRKSQMFSMPNFIFVNCAIEDVLKSSRSSAFFSLILYTFCLLLMVFLHKVFVIIEAVVFALVPGDFG